MSRASGRSLFVVLAGFGPARDGSIAVMLALFLPLLIGGMALAIDLSRAANLQTELQDAADAAALAGATQLDGTSGSRARAIQAAAKEGARIAENAQRFGDTFESVVEIDDKLAGNTDIKIYVDLVSKTLAATDDTANFIEVKAAPRSVTYLFAGFIGLVDAEPIARAVAGYDELVCDNEPMFICNPDEPSGGGNAAATFAANSYKGSAITIQDDRFGYKRANGIAGGGLACGNLARIVKTENECLTTTADVFATGVAAFGECLNVRFDMYPNGSGIQGALGGARTAQNFSPAVNVVKGLVHPDQVAGVTVTIPPGESCELNNEWNSPVSPYLGPGQHTGVTLPETMTYPNDNCAYGVGPACDFGSDDQIGFGVWDIGTYAATQHASYGITGDPNGTGINDPGPALAEEVNDWLDTQNLDFNDDGNTGPPTRYEVYLWEVSQELPEKLDANASCSTQMANTERRVVTAAVVNCNAAGVVGGLFLGAPLARPAAVDLFLIEPLGVSDTDSFYAEIIGPSKARKRVVLYE